MVAVRVFIREKKSPRRMLASGRSDVNWRERLQPGDQTEREREISPPLIPPAYHLGAQLTAHILLALARSGILLTLRVGLCPVIVTLTNSLREFKKKKKTRCTRRKGQCRRWISLGGSFTFLWRRFTWLMDGWMDLHQHPMRESLSELAGLTVPARTSLHNSTPTQCLLVQLPDSLSLCTLLRHGLDCSELWLSCLPTLEALFYFKFKCG